ncbi:unnamed protein product [Amoebophrya sp. A25]|nr:unnamed protein product [Amoebophrya sp. A25]|eukprot:GSA25T00010400001.1
MVGTNSNRNSNAPQGVGRPLLALDNAGRISEKAISFLATTLRQPTYASLFFPAHEAAAGNMSVSEYERDGDVGRQQRFSSIWGEALINGEGAQIACVSPWQPKLVVIRKVFALLEEDDFVRCGQLSRKCLWLASLVGLLSEDSDNPEEIEEAARAVRLYRKQLWSKRRRTTSASRTASEGANRDEASSWPPQALQLGVLPAQAGDSCCSKDLCSVFSEHAVAQIELLSDAIAVAGAKTCGLGVYFQLAGMFEAVGASSTAFLIGQAGFRAHGILPFLVKNTNSSRHNSGNANAVISCAQEAGFQRPGILFPELLARPFWTRTMLESLNESDNDREISSSCDSRNPQSSGSPFSWIEALESRVFPVVKSELEAMDRGLHARHVGHPSDHGASFQMEPVGGNHREGGKHDGEVVGKGSWHECVLFTSATGEQYKKELLESKAGCSKLVAVSRTRGQESRSENRDSENTKYAGGDTSKGRKKDDREQQSRSRSCEEVKELPGPFLETRKLLRELIPGYVEMAERGEGEIIISQLSPGSHIKPHCAPNNLRLTAHLGVDIPRRAEETIPSRQKNAFRFTPDELFVRCGDRVVDSSHVQKEGGERLRPKCAIRVGSEWRAWREGEVMLFDDSFEHEVRNDTEERRVVLLIRFWHPGVRHENLQSKVLDTTAQPASDVVKKAVKKNKTKPSHENSDGRGCEFDCLSDMMRTFITRLKSQELKASCEEIASVQQKVRAWVGAGRPTGSVAEELRTDLSQVLGIQRVETDHGGGDSGVEDASSTVSTDSTRSNSNVDCQEARAQMNCDITRNAFSPSSVSGNCIVHENFLIPLIDIPPARGDPEEHDENDHEARGLPPYFGNLLNNRLDSKSSDSLCMKRNQLSAVAAADYMARDEYLFNKQHFLSRLMPLPLFSGLENSLFHLNYDDTKAGCCPFCGRGSPGEPCQVGVQVRPQLYDVVTKNKKGGSLGPPPASSVRWYYEEKDEVDDSTTVKNPAEDHSTRRIKHDVATLSCRSSIMSSRRAVVCCDPVSNVVRVWSCCTQGQAGADDSTCSSSSASERSSPGPRQHSQKGSITLAQALETLRSDVEIVQRSRRRQEPKGDQPPRFQKFDHSVHLRPELRLLPVETSGRTCNDADAAASEVAGSGCSGGTLRSAVCGSSLGLAFVPSLTFFCCGGSVFQKNNS